MNVNAVDDRFTAPRINFRANRIGEQRLRCGMVKARRRLSRPELDTERARERLRALIEQGRQYLIPARECPNFSETYREKVVKYINEVSRSGCPQSQGPYP